MRAKILAIAGLILLILALTMTPCCKTSSYQIAHQQETLRYDTGYVPDDPAPLKTELTKTINMSIALGYEDEPTEGTMYEIKMAVVDIRRGEKAWELLKNIEGNQPAPEGYDYIIAELSLRFTAVASSTRWFEQYEFVVDRSEFQAQSPDGTDFEIPDAQPPEPAMRGSIIGGQTMEGWLVFLVPKTELKPYLDYTKENLYFRLY